MLSVATVAPALLPWQNRASGGFSIPSIYTIQIVRCREPLPQHHDHGAAPIRCNVTRGCCALRQWRRRPLMMASPPSPCISPPLLPSNLPRRHCLANFTKLGTPVIGAGYINRVTGVELAMACTCLCLDLQGCMAFGCTPRCPCTVLLLDEEYQSHCTTSNQ